MSQSFSIENAKSGRASCKKCKEKIGKGELRIGVISPGPGDFDMTSWYHPACYTIGRKLKKEGVTAATFVSELLQDNTDALNLEEIADEIVAAVESKPAPPGGDAKGGGGGGGSGPGAKVAKMKSDLEKIRLREEEDLEEGPPKKKSKAAEETSKLTDDDRAAAEVYAVYAPKKNDELKDYLRWNGQMVSGPKDELLVRCVDGHMNGRLGACPSCLKGRLKLTHEDPDVVACNGWFDEEVQVKHTCLYTCKREEAPRLQPWYTQEPSEEEKEEMERVRKGGQGAKVDDALTSSILPLAAEIHWDLSTPAGIKKTTKALLEMFRTSDSLNLPEDDTRARMEIGKVVLAEKDASPGDGREEICKVLVEHFGVKKTKEEEDAGHEAMASLCVVPGNGPVYEAMNELADCYFAEKNSNAGATYRKVAAAVKDLEFEITEDNAKGLGKNKTKVAGIGKGSAEKIHELLATGKIEKLEEKRAALGRA